MLPDRAVEANKSAGTHRAGLPYIAQMNYLRTHWLGEQPLFRSFWINFVALRLVLWALPVNVIAPGPLPLYLVGVAIAADFSIFIWQLVGVVRSAENHMLARGGMAPTWGIYASIAVAVFGIATHWLGLFQMTLAKPDSELFTTRMDRMHASRYELTVSDDGNVMRLSGTVELGVTKALAALLDNNSGIGRIELNSAGGNIYEARALHRCSCP